MAQRRCRGRFFDHPHPGVPAREYPYLHESRCLTMLKQIMSLARLDLSPPHRPPAPGRMSLTTAASVIGSFLVDALLVLIGEAVFPGTKGYVHFRFSDYTKLTVIGVIIACVAWPVVARAPEAIRDRARFLKFMAKDLLWTGPGVNELS